MHDELAKTVDYYAVCKAVQALARERPRKLIETLAAEIVEMLLAQFAIAAVDLELRKYILPDTEFVAVRLRRTQSG
jgi:dihydroneopterin aldolase